MSNVATFVKRADGQVELVGGIWPAWMHIDPLLLAQADAAVIRVAAGHIEFHVANGSARYVISGFTTLDGGWPYIIADRVA